MFCRLHTCLVWFYKLHKFFSKQCLQCSTWEALKFSSSPLGCWAMCWWTLGYALLRYDLLCYALLWSAMLHLALLCVAMISYLCSAMLLHIFAENTEKPSVFLGFWTHIAKQHYKTCDFCNMLLEILETKTCVSCVFTSKVLRNNVKHMVFAKFCWTCWKTMCFPLFLHTKC